MSCDRQKTLNDVHETDLVSKEILLSEVAAWAKRIGVEEKIREIHVRPMKRKWASVSTRGRLTLSADLMKEPSDVRRKVIVHELVHLKLENGSHGKLFRSLVEAYISNR